MLNVTRMRETYIFRGSVSFLMFKVILDSTSVIGISDETNRSNQSNSELTAQIWKKNKHAKVWKKLQKYFCKRVSVQSVQIIQFFCFSINFFFFYVEPPVNVWHTAILSNKNMWLFSIVAFEYLGSGAGVLWQVWLKIQS